MIGPQIRQVSGHNRDLLVFTSETVPADAEWVDEGGDAAPEAYFGAGDVIPMDGHFEALQAKPARNVEDLDIETKTIEPLARKNGAGGLRLEQFESALRVAKGEAGD